MNYHLFKLGEFKDMDLGLRHFKIFLKLITLVLNLRLFCPYFQ